MQVSEAMKKSTPSPGFLCFGIVDNCMLRCKMCYKWKEDILVENHTKAPTMTDWKRAVDALKEMTDPGFLINFGGGEALIKKDLLELVKYCHDRGFRTNIATNAFLIDEDMAKRIADSGLDSVNISLDSLDEKIHDYLRGVPGIYKRVMNAIEYLDRYCKNFEIEICCVIYNINRDGIIDLARWADSDSRINWIVFMVPMQPNNSPNYLGHNWWENKEYDFLWPKDHEKACAIINELLELKGQGYKISNQVCQLEAFKNYLRYPGSFVKKSPCNLDKALHVSAVGDIFICYGWESIGNIKTHDLNERWYSKEADNIRDKVVSCSRNCHFLLNCYFEGDYPFEVERKNHILDVKK